MNTDEPITVVCCFCAQSIPYAEATKLVIAPPGNDPGEQVLYCHADHLREVVIDSIVLLTELRNSEAGES